jgi:site-specific recombinase XerD
MPKSPVAADSEPLANLLGDWQIHLRARNVSRATITSYVSVATRFVRFMDSRGLPSSPTSIKRENIEQYLAELADQVVGRGRKPTTMSPATVA